MLDVSTDHFAARLSTSKSSNYLPDPNATAVCRQIGQTSFVAAVNLLRDAATQRTKRCRRTRVCDRTDLSSADLDMLDGETGRQQQLMTIRAHRWALPKGRAFI